MIIDLHRAPLPADVTFDVCVVGAGAAGISLSLELVRQGRRVALLEGGGRGFELRSQALYAGESYGLPYSGLYNGRSRVLGGTTTQWGGQALEIDAHVFEKRPGAASAAWPFPKSELADAYRRAARIEGLADALADGEAIWTERGFGPADFGPDLATDFSRWCPVTDFAQLHRTRLASDPLLFLLLHANVCELLLRPDGSAVRSVRVRTFSGHDVELSARHYVLAMGGIEVCRLLLQPPRNGGIYPWQSTARVGRHFQDHITCHIATLDPGALSPARYFDYFALNGLKYQPKLKLRPTAQARLETLDVGGTFVPTQSGIDDVFQAYETYRMWRTRQWRTLTGPRLFNLARHVPALLWHRYPRFRLARATSLPWRFCVQCEQTPQSSGQIRLTNDRDRLGMLRVGVDWRTGDQELHSIRAFLRVVRESFRACGHGDVVPDPGVEDDDDALTAAFTESYHHIGGTRMATSENDGVVDPNLRIFSVENAYVCSSSVFPSAGFVNPTHTVIALAVRLAEHLHARLTADRAPLTLPPAALT